jgi:ribosome-associated heat shock protein Hsp15
VVRTRSAAAVLVTSGLVRLNGTRIDAPSRTVRKGDAVTIALDRSVRVLKVSGFAERRGDASSVQALYEDISAPPPPPGSKPPPVAAREPGAARPTKRERRDMERFTGGDDF